MPFSREDNYGGHRDMFHPDVLLPLFSGSVLLIAIESPTAGASVKMEFGVV